MSDLFDAVEEPAPLEPRARRTDPATSHAAALNAGAKAARSHYVAIMGVLWRPMHCYEIARLTGLTNVQVDRRLPELQRRGEIRPTGETAPGGPSGSECRLWERVIG